MHEETIIDVIEFFRDHLEVKRQDSSVRVGDKRYSVSKYRVKDMIRIDIKEKK